MEIRTTILSLGVLILLWTSSFPLSFAEKSSSDFPFTGSDEPIIQATTYLLNKQDPDGNINGLITSAWAAMALSLINEQHASFHNLTSYLIGKTSLINTEKITDIERHILALISCNIHENNSRIRTLIQHIYASYDGTQIGDLSNIYDDIFGILSLISIGERKDSAIITTIKNHIKAKQRNDGSWGDVDTTAAAIMSLLQTGEHTSSPIIQNALTYLQTKQEPSGGFHSWGSANIASTAWVVNALITAKINPCSDAWTTHGNTSIDFILSLQQEDGSFNYSHQERMNPEWMTSYALVALLGKTYPVRVKTIDIPPDEDPPEDSSDDEEQDEEEKETEDDPSLDKELNLTLIHPDKKGFYMYNKKTKIPTQRLICFGPLDITVIANDEVDVVRFLVDGSCCFEDRNPPYRFSLNHNIFIKKIGLTIEAICFKESIDTKNVDLLLTQLLMTVRTYYQTPSNDLACAIEEMVHEINKMYIKQIFTIQFSLIYMNILGII